MNKKFLSILFITFFALFGCQESSTPKSTPQPEKIKADFGKGLSITLDKAKKNERLALIITNQSYDVAKYNNIQNATQDGQQIAKLLGPDNGLGYDVTHIVDKDGSTTLRAIDSFSKKVGTDSTVVVYYSGHGICERRCKSRPL